MEASHQCHYDDGICLKCHRRRTMDKSGPFTHPPDDWINPGPITDADRIASYQRDRERDRKRIAELKAEVERLEAENAKLKEALREIADSVHLGNSWARHKAKAALIQEGE